MRIGLAAAPQPPVRAIEDALHLVQEASLDSFMVWDHLADFAPEAF